MKKTKGLILVAITILFSIGVFSYISCNKKSEFEQCHNTRTIHTPFIQKSHSFSDDIQKTINFLEIDKYKTSPRACVSAWLEQSTTPSEMVKLLNSFGINKVNNENKLLSIEVFCYNNGVPYQIDNNNIYGFLVLSYDDRGYMYTQVFQKVNNHFVYLPKFDSKIWRLSVDERNYLASFLSGRENNLGYAINLFNYEANYEEATIGSKINLFNHRLYKELGAPMTLVANSVRGKFYSPEFYGEGDKCSETSTEDCLVSGKGTCTKSGGTWICNQDKNVDDQICAGSVAYEVASRTNSNTMNQTVRFRDSVLSKSVFGNYFIENLEYMGVILKNNLSVSDAIALVNIMESTIVPLAEKLNSEGVTSDNSIFINTEQTNLMRNAILILRGVSNDALFNEILDEMDVNIDYIQNRTTSDIYHDLITS